MAKSPITDARDRILTGLAVAAIAIMAFAPGRALIAERLHLRLEASAPAADQIVSGVDQIRLEFSQTPQMTGTRIRVLSAGAPLDLGDAIASEEDETVVLLPLSTELRDGAYEVRWRAMSQDGHPVTGDFAFTVETRAR